MRSYEQICPVARALDLVGDRWTLLIVRELLIRERCRYADLQYGLPGIATNLLADRLGRLEEEGIITRVAASPPVATGLFHLTPRGETLRPVVEALAEWGRPLLEEPSQGATFRTHWLAIPVELFLRDLAPNDPPVTIELRTGGEPLLIQTLDGKVEVQPGTVREPDAMVTGAPSLISSLVTGELDLESARARGVQIDGDQDALRRVLSARPEVVG